MKDPVIDLATGLVAIGTIFLMFVSVLFALVAIFLEEKYGVALVWLVLTILSAVLLRQLLKDLHEEDSSLLRLDQTEKPKLGEKR